MLFEAVLCWEYGVNAYFDFEVPAPDLAGAADLLPFPLPSLLSVLEFPFEDLSVFGMVKNI
ncbi:hypothetical protein MASR1M74_05810 [Lentimicrobium sp.]